MDVVLVIGRIALASLFIFSGAAFHFKKDAIEYARASGAPAPDTLVPLSGVAFIVGGVMVALGLWADLGALILLASIIPISLYMHAFWKSTDPQDQQNQFNHFFKNVQVIGGLVLVFWAYNQGQDLPASLTDSLFDAW